MDSRAGAAAPRVAANSGLAVGDVRGFRLAPAGWFALVLVIAMLLAYADRAQILADNVEVGDFAANGLLIQKAKSLSLWVGNYSRVGFNHPGPAILYVLAAGEVVFHDWLRIVPSPLSGQLVAVGFYNASWIVLMLAVFRRSLPMRSAVVVTASFVAISTLIDYELLMGLWFPELYFFPFAVFLLGLTRIARGADDSFWIVALAGGFLVNGHVSFIAILCVMVACALVGNAFLHWNDPARWLVHPAFLRAHRRAFLGSFAIAGVFLVPLLIATITDYPGPIADYIRFGSGRPPNKLDDAVQFVASYWGGLLPFFAGMLVTTSLISRREALARRRFSDAPYVAVSVLGATIATLVYARYGVDFLEYKYVAHFYYAAPALLASVASMLIVRFLDERLTAGATAVVVVTMLAGCYIRAGRAPQYAPQLQAPEVRELARELQRHKGQGRIVLNLDNSRRWPEVWSRITGAQLIAARAGEVPFCIGTNWHILFTKSAKCTPDELALNQRYAVTTAAPEATPQEAFRAGGLSFTPLVPPQIQRPGAFRSLRSPTLSAASSLGPAGPRSNPDLCGRSGKRPISGFRCPTATPARCSLTCWPSRLDRQTRSTRSSSRMGVCSPRRIDAATPRKIVELRILEGMRVGRLQLRIREPIAPSSVSNSKDPRQLGVALYGIALQQR